MKGLPTCRPPAAAETVPRIFTLADPAEDFHRLMDRNRSAALCGYIHAHRFHLTVIRTLEDIERYAGDPSAGIRKVVRCCSSCGAPLPGPALCTRCRLYF
jgi:hypothetical protein